jgi:hypothetical protein
LIAPHLRIQPGQKALTPEQEAEARRFAEACIQAHLSTEPVDEPEAEALLRQAYAVVGLVPPQHIYWLDGPLQLVAVRSPVHVDASVRESVKNVAKSVWESVKNVPENVENIARAKMWDTLNPSEWDSVVGVVRDRVWVPRGENNVRKSVENIVGDSVNASVCTRVGARVCARVIDRKPTPIKASGAWAFVCECVGAYYDASWLACAQFFDCYLAPNALHALAHFNVQVSGYWLGKNTAVLVRRPARLSRDRQGRLHSATGKCIEYPDGWGFYAWHGVQVPERVILDPDRLTREDFHTESNVEVRRVIQERMGSRFVAELGGVVLDRGPRGTLYEVALPDDPERVARYVQVQDASTPRQYVLRVPPTIQTAAEAVAWSFQVGVEDYHPTQET